jgi:hypothetical protein
MTIMTKSVSAVWSEDPAGILSPDFFAALRAQGKILEDQDKTDNIVDVSEDGLVRKRSFIDQETAEHWTEFGLELVDEYCKDYPGLFIKYEINNISN